MTQKEMAEEIYIGVVSQQECESVDSYQLKAMAQLAWDAAEVWDEIIVFREFGEKP